MKKWWYKRITYIYTPYKNQRFFKRNMSRYKQGKIYKLCCAEFDCLYVGSTIQELCKRKSTHNRDFKNNPNSKFSKILLKKNIVFKNIDIILIEKYPCKNKIQLRKRECYWMNKLKPNGNSNKPTKYGYK